MDWSLLGAVGATGCGFVLVSAGWWKLRHRPAFALALRDHGPVVTAGAGWLALLLPVAELAVGLGATVCALPPSARGGWVLWPMWLPMLGMVVLGGTFAAYASVQLAHGRRPRCGCLDSHDRLSPHTVVRASVIGLGGLGGWLTTTPGASPVPGPHWTISVLVEAC
jgi:hypothetical protein